MGLHSWLSAVRGKLMTIEFCLPVYNEEKILKDNILKLLNYCQKQNFNFHWRIVIINNGSTDHSLFIANDLAKKYPKNITVENIKQDGKGRAIKTYGLKSKADIMAYMDIDLAVSLNNIFDLVSPVILNKADLVIGSRLLPDSKTDRTFFRGLSSQIYILLAKIILSHNFSDLQCGFKAIKTNIFKKIIPYIENNKWFFDTELITYVNHFGYLIKEIPVDWSENRYQKRKSKLNLIKGGFKFIINLIKLKIQILKVNKTKGSANTSI